MKTIESIMRSIAREEQEKSVLLISVKCEECGAMEGPKSIYNSATTTLTKIQLEGNKMLVCQECIKSKNRKLDKKTKKKFMEKLRNYIATLFGVLVLTIVLFGTINAQPPGLPGDPSQAPIDGGLGLLIAAGGVYAYKKLRNNKE